MTIRSTQARSSALRIVGGELRGALASVTALVSSWKQGAGVVTRWRTSGRSADGSDASRARTGQVAVSLDDDGSRQGERDPQVVITDMRYRTAIRVLVRHIIELRAAQERAAIAPAPAPAERSADEEREERMLALRVALDRARAERAALRRWASKEAGHPA